MAIRITYNSVNVDLLVGEAGLETTYKQERKENRASSGKIETINIYGIQELRFAAYFDEDTYRDLIAWWSWARQGKTWAFAMDSGNVGNTTLDDAAAAAQKNVPLTATAAFASGDYCLLRAADNDDEFEIVEVDSVDAGVKIVAIENLIFTYAASDIFRHWDYWPEVITIDKDFNPKKNGDMFKHTFKFVEAL